MMKMFLALCLVAVASAYPLEEESDLPFEYVVEYIPVLRQRRSLQPGAPNIPLPNQDPQSSVSPHVVTKDGTTNVGITYERKTPNYDVNAHINQNVRGPQRSSRPNYSVRGTYRW